ncbi:MAG TPA: ABC transporter permease [Chitinophagaceae bacterium]|nr:ABC transporter permease [Chitinophagaceae bacterium]
MIKNYFKTAWRNISNNKIFSAINVFGLSIGLACCILMFLFIQHELSYDKFHSKSKNIYRLISEERGAAEKKTLAITPAPWAPLIKKDYPEVKEYVRLLKDEKVLVGEKGKEHSFLKTVLLVDSAFFNVFSFKLLNGNAATALTQPNSIILTKDAAKKYFGDADPIGKTIEAATGFTGPIDVQVTGVIEEAPASSHIKFDALMSMSSLGDLSNTWSYHMHNTYVVLSDGASKNAVEAKLRSFSDKYLANNPNADAKHDIFLQPLTDIHLRSHLVGELETNGDITYVYIFSGIALFVLLIACLNFMNLSTVRSLKRAKEVGMRKVVGAERNQLIKQFLSESVLVAFFALIFSLVIVVAVLPVFNQLSERSLTINFFKNYYLILILIALTGIVGLLSGIYPASVLSSFNPVEVLKGSFQKSIKGGGLRKILVTVQFVISITLIASTILVYKQLQFVQNKKLGFDKEKVIIATIQRNTDIKKTEALKNSLLNVPGVISVSAASTIPSTKIPVNMIHDENSAIKQNRSMQMLFVDHDFARTLKMKLVEGRDFSVTHATDVNEGFIINQEAAKQLGWKIAKDAVGRSFQWVMPDTVLKNGKIVGVVEDFNITPLKTAVQPLVMHILPRRFQYLYIRVSSNNALSAIENKFKEFNAEQPFEYTFLDDTINAMYASEKKLGKIFGYFSGLAILIACMGILGLSIYAAQQRIKEIGIRKVLGASTISIVRELSKEFLKPVIIASLIATPIAWWAMHTWLQDFAYRINISWWVFVVAGIIAIIIALATVSFQAIKAAVSNPVKSLRTE